MLRVERERVAEEEEKNQPFALGADATRRMKRVAVALTLFGDRDPLPFPFSCVFTLVGVGEIPVPVLFESRSCVDDAVRNEW